jgi:hypothetical protein
VPALIAGGRTIERCLVMATGLALMLLEVSCLIKPSASRTVQAEASVPVPTRSSLPSLALGRAVPQGCRCQSVCAP